MTAAGIIVLSVGRSDAVLTEELTPKLVTAPRSRNATATQRTDKSQSEKKFDFEKKLSDADNIELLLATGGQNECDKAWELIKDSISARPKFVADNIKSWLQPLFDVGRYENLRELTQAGIKDNYSDSATLSECLRSQALAALNSGNPRYAVATAWRYFSSSQTKQSRTAVAVLAEAIDQQNPNKNESLGTALIIDQLVDAGTMSEDQAEKKFKNYKLLAKSAWAIVENNSSGFEFPLSDQPVASPGTTEDLLRLGNKRLIEGRFNGPEGALTYFCKAGINNDCRGKKLVSAIEGVACAVRGIDKSHKREIELIENLKQKKAILPEVQAIVGSKADEVALAASRLSTIALTEQLIPPESERMRRTELVATENEKVKIESAIPYSSPFANVVYLSPSHIRICVGSRLTGRDNWFYFKIRNPKKRTVRIDFVKTQDDRYEAINPVWTASGVEDNDGNPSEPKTFVAANGTVCPKGAGNGWRYLRDTWNGPGTLCTIANFEDDSLVAMRVPYTADDDERLANFNAATKRASRVIGTTTQGHQMRIYDFPQLTKNVSGATQPTLLIYAREHADEQDGSWAAAGAVKFLASDSPAAASIRSRMGVIVIPILDNDGAAVGVHQSIMNGFGPIEMARENVVYADWLTSEIIAGRSIFLSINLHNVPSGAPHISCAVAPGFGATGRAADRFNEMLASTLNPTTFSMELKPWSRGIAPYRLGGWLASTYGCISLHYELNSQERTRHLSTDELGDIGSSIINAASSYLEDPVGQAAFKVSDDHRSTRLQLRKKHANELKSALKNVLLEDGVLDKVSNWNIRKGEKAIK